MGWQKRLENHLLAATFAQAGEFGTARNILKADRKVLLALAENQPTQGVLSCTLNLCQRVNAGLDILLVYPGQDLSPQLKGFLHELKTANVGFHLIHKAGRLGAEILRYVNEQRNIAFVVIDSLDHWGDRKFAAPWRKLACPLVVASNK